MRGKRAELDRVTLTQAEMKAVMVLIDRISGGEECTQTLVDLHFRLRTTLLRNVRFRQIQAGTYVPGNATGGDPEKTEK